MAKKKKPAPISMKLSKRAVARVEDAPVKPFNEVSPITQAQMDRAEKSIDKLRADVSALRAVPKPRTPDAPVVNVSVPARARIAKVTIKYDQLGFPSELIPQYAEPAV